MSGKKGLDFVKAVSSYMTQTNAFDRCLQQIQIVKGGDGKCEAVFKVAPEQLNRAGGLHGGFMATIVDVVTTYALMTADHHPGVSTDIHMSYLKGAKEGDEVIIDARTVRAGRNLAFLECELRHKKDNSVIARGSHTKFIGGHRHGHSPSQEHDQHKHGHHRHSQD